MHIRRVLLGLATAIGAAATASAQLLPIGGSTSAPQLDPVQIEISQAITSDKSMNVVPFEFDPTGLNLAHSSWLTGTGCTAEGLADPLCAELDPRDARHEGLLLVKTGSTGNPVAAGARINGVKGMPLTELGYDIRKPLLPTDPRGSHCGAGAPRFNVVSEGVNYFIGCNSPPGTPTLLGAGWIRLRWMGPTLVGFAPDGVLTPLTGKTIDSITIIFDEGQDTGGPDNFGAAILDNIDVSGQIAGRGPHGGK